MKYGYARVSTDGQSVYAQVRQLTKAGNLRPHRPCCQRSWHMEVSRRLVPVAERRRIQLFRLHRHAGAKQQKAIDACPTYREERRSAASVLSESEHNRQLRRALLASTIGTTIEW